MTTHKTTEKERGYQRRELGLHDKLNYDSSSQGTIEFLHWTANQQPVNTNWY